MAMLNVLRDYPIWATRSLAASQKVRTTHTWMEAAETVAKALK